NRRRGKFDDAAKELQASLAERDSAFVHTLLARIYLEQKKFDLARTELERSLKLAPNYADAKQLLDHLQNSKPNGGGQCLAATLPLVPGASFRSCPPLCP